MILDLTTRKIQMALAGAVQTTQAAAVASWVDMTGTSSVPAAATALTASAAVVDLVPSPPANASRIVQSLSICNRDTVPAVASVYYTDGVNAREVIRATLAPAQSLLYSPGSGWTISAAVAIAKTQCAFSAWKNGTDQTGIASAVSTKITYGATLFNLGGFYNSVTSRFTPPAGIVVINASIAFNGGVVVGGITVVQIQKNGIALKNVYGAPANTTFCSNFVSALDISTGTDYYEVFGFADGAGTKSISGSVTNSFFTGAVLD